MHEVTWPVVGMAFAAVAALYVAGKTGGMLGIIVLCLAAMPVIASLAGVK